MGKIEIPHKVFALIIAGLYVAYSMGVTAYACTALLGLAYALSVLCGHEPLGRGERVCALGLMVAAVIALGMACGLAGIGGLSDPAVREVWV